MTQPPNGDKSPSVSTALLAPGLHRRRWRDRSAVPERRVARYPGRQRNCNLCAGARGLRALQRRPELRATARDEVRRNDDARRVTLRFVIALAALFAGTSSWSASIVWRLAARHGVRIDDVLRASSWPFMPAGACPGAHGYPSAFVGLLVQQRLTGRVTLERLPGRNGGPAAHRPCPGSRCHARARARSGRRAALHARLAGLVVWRHPPLATDPDARVRRFVLRTGGDHGVMFAISRPVLYAFVARMPEGVGASRRFASASISHSSSSRRPISSATSS